MKRLLPLCMASATATTKRAGSKNIPGPPETIATISIADMVWCFLLLSAFGFRRFRADENLVLSSSDDLLILSHRCVLLPATHYQKSTYVTRGGRRRRRRKKESSRTNRNQPMKVQFTFFLNRHTLIASLPGS